MTPEPSLQRYVAWGNVYEAGEDARETYYLASHVDPILARQAARIAELEREKATAADLADNNPIIAEARRWWFKLNKSELLDSVTATRVGLLLTGLDSQAQRLSEQAAEMERMRRELVRVRNELRGVGTESSKEFHRIGISSALEMLDSALAARKEKT